MRIVVCKLLSTSRLARKNGELPRSNLGSALRLQVSIGYLIFPRSLLLRYTLRNTLRVHNGNIIGLRHNYGINKSNIFLTVSCSSDNKLGIGWVHQTGRAPQSLTLGTDFRALKWSQFVIHFPALSYGRRKTFVSLKPYHWDSIQSLTLSIYISLNNYLGHHFSLQPWIQPSEDTTDKSASADKIHLRVVSQDRNLK